MRNARGIRKFVVCIYYFRCDSFLNRRINNATNELIHLIVQKQTRETVKMISSNRNYRINHNP